MPPKKILAIFCIIFLISCSEKTSRRLPYKKVDDGTSGVEGLNAGRNELYKKLQSLVKESRSETDIFIPREGESYLYKLKLSEMTTSQFTLKNTAKKCRFKYGVIEIEETISAGTSSDDFFIDRKLSPIGAIYDGLPSQDLEKKCKDSIDKLIVFKSKRPIDIKKSVQSFRKMIREQFLNIIEICKKKKNIAGFGKCEKLQIFELEEKDDGPRESDSIYYFSGEITKSSKRYPIKIIFSLRNTYWGVGGLFLWESETIFFSKTLDYGIKEFQSLRLP